MTRKPVGAVYECKRKHKRSHYFFDGKPETVPCDTCGNGVMARFVRDLELERDESALRKFREGRKTTPIT
jgi:hypothetical protein